MTALKKIILAPFAVAALAASVQAMAAQERHTIQLEATIPSSDFFVQPADSSWIGNPQVLAWNPVSGDLSTLSKHFHVKHTAGSIEGSVLDIPKLYSASDEIELKVAFNGVELGTDPVEVVSATEAGPGATVLLDIAAVKAGEYTPGRYAGNVQLAFDAVIAN